MFNKGNSKGLIASIPIGGHMAPNSTVGDNALWKKAQNIAKKNKASETINKATPIFKPLWTAKVWLPKYVPSAIISRNHNDIDAIKVNRDKPKKYPALSNRWNVDTAVVVTHSKLILVNKGHGDGETKWKGCPWKLLLFIIDMIIFIFYTLH